MTTPLNTLDRIEKAISDLLSQVYTLSEVESEADYQTREARKVLAGDLPLLHALVEAIKAHDNYRTELEKKYNRPDLYFSVNNSDEAVRKAVRALEEKP